MQPPLSTQSDAKLIKMLQHRRAAKSQATTPSNLSTSSRDTLSFSTGKGYRINTSLPRLPNLSAAQIPIGVSAAFLVSSLVDCRNQEDPTTRAAYRLLQSKGETLCGCVPQRQTVDFTADLSKHPLDPPTHPTHPITGGRIIGPSRTHVAHAWDAKFEALVDCLLHDAGSDLDRRYNLDIFNAQEMESIPSAGRSTVSTDNSGEDSVESLQAIVAGVQEVLLVLDKDALCFSRLWDGCSKTQAADCIYDLLPRQHGKGYPSLGGAHRCDRLDFGHIFQEERWATTEKVCGESLGSWNWYW